MKEGYLNEAWKALRLQPVENADKNPDDHFSNALRKRNFCFDPYRKSLWGNEPILLIQRSHLIIGILRNAIILGRVR